MPAIKNAHIRYRIIDNCIRNKFRPFPSMEELRSACEDALYGSDDGEHISISTIEKDLFNMRMEMDAPIKYNKREDGYYYSNANFSINDIPLSDEELESIRFATKTLMQFKDTSMFQQFGLAIDKIFDRISAPNDNIKDEEEIIQFERGFSSSGNQYLPDLLEAIKNKLIIHFGYESFQSGKYKNRRVLPLLLKEYRNRWYLITYDLDKTQVITYALERMDNLSITKEIYENEVIFSAKEFFQYATGITAGNNKIEDVEFEISKISSKYIETQPFHSSQIKISTNEEVDIYSMRVLISEELIRNILSFGGEIKVLKPKTLRDDIANRLEVAIRNYVK